MKKLLAGISLAFACAGFSVAGDIKIDFYNKLYTDNAVLYHHEYDWWGDSNNDGLEEKYTNKDTKSDFPAIKNLMFAEIKTEKVDAMAKGTFAIDDDYDGGHHFGIDGEINDYYIAFRPFKPLTLSLHRNDFANGSLLPVYADKKGYNGHVWAGNIGSHGFTATYSPELKKGELRFAATVPFNTISESADGRTTNWIDGENSRGEDEELDIGLGVIYSLDIIEIGASVQDVADDDERQIAGFIDLPGLFGALPALKIGGGIAHTEAKLRTASTDLISVGGCNFTFVSPLGATITYHHTYGLSYQNLLSSYVDMNFEHFELKADLLYNFSEDNEYVWAPGCSYDLYSAVQFLFKISSLNAKVTGKILKDFTDNGADMALFGGFGLSYQVNEQNEVGAGIEGDFCSDNWHLAFPVYWKYSIKQ